MVGTPRLDADSATVLWHLHTWADQHPGNPNVSQLALVALTGLGATRTMRGLHRLEEAGLARHRPCRWNPDIRRWSATDGAR